MVGLNNVGFHDHAAMPQQMMGKLSQGCVANWPQGPVAKLPQGRVAKLPLVHAMSASCAFICPVNIIIYFFIYLFVRANSRACICNNWINFGHTLTVNGAWWLVCMVGVHGRCAW